ncbi:MAG: GspH/FimT family pseudopilin [Porticoccaceae bacterium]|nr:GspH/FimT family pseudopilin [Porticoccaceae bacterium]
MKRTHFTALNRSALNVGFTLFDLLFCLAIISILVSLSFSSNTAAVADQKIISQIYDIRNALKLAQTLAITRGETVTACLIDVNGHCVSENGDAIAVFIDTNDNHQLDNSEIVVSEAVISGTTVVLSASGHNKSYVRFKPVGSAMESGNFLVCNDNPALGTGRKVVFYYSGRIYLSSDTNGDGFHDVNGNKVECPVN